MASGRGAWDRRRPAVGSTKLLLPLRRHSLPFAGATHYTASGFHELNACSLKQSIDIGSGCRPLDVSFIHSFIH